jgi:flavin-dependent dehydrogenase
MHPESSQLKTDVLIVGGGPAGLACAIHLARQARPPRHILVLEKSAHPGGHLLSGAVLRPESLQALLTPEEFAALPLGPVVTRDSFHALTPARAVRLPFVPPKMRMRGLPLVSAAALGRALSPIAAGLGAEILHGQTADALVWDGERVAGVRCESDRILAPTTVLAEGPAGLLARELFARRPEMPGRHLQTHGIGLKEIIEVPADPAAAGTVVHTFGYPLGLSIYGGGFIYRFDATHVALGLALALDYTDPAVHPHELFRQWKRHPLVQAQIAGGQAVEYGARLVPEGGWHSRTRMEAPGAFVIGDSAGLVDTMELKGLHLAVESGMAVADAIARGGPLSRKTSPRWRACAAPQLPRRLPRRPARRHGRRRAGLADRADASPGAASPARRTRLPASATWRRRRPQRPRQRTARSRHGFRPLPRPPAHPRRLRTHRDQGCGVCRECFATYAAPCTPLLPRGRLCRRRAEPAILVRAENCVQCRCCT